VPVLRCASAYQRARECPSTAGLLLSPARLIQLGAGE
jgi:hypothetical protein